jgi:RNA polymerase sigma factor (sigma-70 family)
MALRSFDGRGDIMPFVTQRVHWHLLKVHRKNESLRKQTNVANIPDQIDHTQRVEQADWLDNLLGKLTQKERLIFQTKVLHGTKRTAEITNMNRQTVRYHYNQILVKLKKLVREEAE